MAEKVTLQNPDTGRIVRTDNAEEISNLRYGRGFRVVTEPATPAVPEATAAPTQSAEEPAGHETQDVIGPAARGPRR